MLSRGREEPGGAPGGHYPHFRVRAVARIGTLANKINLEFSDICLNQNLFSYPASPSRFLP